MIILNIKIYILIIKISIYKFRISIHKLSKADVKLGIRVGSFAIGIGKNRSANRLFKEILSITKAPLLPIYNPYQI